MINFNIKGLFSKVRFGKGNGFIEYVTNLFKFTKPNGDLTNLQIADAVNDNEAVTKNQLDTKQFYAGIADVNVPIFTDNGDGTFNIATTNAVIFDNANFTGVPKKYIIPTFNGSLNDGDNKFICIRYNTGTPEYYIESTESNINCSSIILVYTLWRQGTTIHSRSNDSEANGLANKIEQSTKQKEPYKRSKSGGLILSENLRYILISYANVYYGSVIYEILSFNSNTDLLTFVYYNGSTWIYTNESQYRNTQRNPITGLVELDNNNKFSVAYFYRSIGDVKQTFYVLSENQYNNAIEADNDMQRSDIPNLLYEHCILVGRIIFQKSAASGLVQSAFEQYFSNYPTINHNDTANKQGGTTDQYYHLTSAEHTIVQNTSGTNTGDQNLSGLVPYTGATQNADLGNYILTSYLNTLTKEPTGFINNNLVTINYNSTNRTITLTGTIDAYYQGKKVTALVSGWVSDAHTNATGEYFLFYNGTSFVWQTSAWSFDMLQIAYIYFGATSKYAIFEAHGLMPYEVHKQLHSVVGTYRSAGGDIAALVANSTTAANRRPTISQCTINDEDIASVLSAVSNSLYTHYYLTSTGTSNYLVDKTDIIQLSGTRPYYNQFTGGVWQQTLMTDGYYQKILILAIPVTADSESQKYRFVFVQGQTQNQNVSTIQALTINNYTLGTITQEYVAIAEIIIRYQSSNWVITSFASLSGTKVSQVSTPSGNFLSSVTISGNTLSGNGTAGSPLTTIDPVKKIASSTNGYIPAWNGTTGDQLTDGYAVQKTIAGSATLSLVGDFAEYIVTDADINILSYATIGISSNGTLAGTLKWTAYNGYMRFYSTVNTDDVLFGYQIFI